MGFTFNSQDIRKGVIDFAGDFNVEIVEAKYLGTNAMGGEGFNLTYKVLDGSEKGKMIFGDYFNDDQARTDGEAPSFYKNINALFNAIGGVQDGAVIELKNVSQILVGKRLAVKVREFKPNDYKQRTTYRPEVADYGTLLPNGSEVDKTTQRPQAHAAGKKPLAQGDMIQPDDSQGFDPFGSTPVAAPANDPFG
ncbi:DUF669 domain-containing protein [Weissella coleopterorum]|uniref:DUF669 domain-containing protein n=1 Tax=Weissella coleopterorum TaxID=2714949 RepID=A0A6G8AXU7_9LACO|nr:DUF669 domain-containing protein [Weissella coleopterorum]QIL49888.1 DUF669 domain-containing protein [Weissella coleopterorum]